MDQIVDKLPYGVAVLAAIGLGYAYVRFPKTRKAIAAVAPMLRKRLLRWPKGETKPQVVVDEGGSQPQGVAVPTSRPDERESGSGG